MAYVDGFVLAVPKANIERYKAMATLAGKIWMEHGALQYCECAGDDLAIEGMISFAKIAKAKPGETVIFAWVVFKSRAHRDKVNAKVMKDPRLAKMGPETMPFDCKKMAYGGFKTLVNL